MPDTKTVTKTVPKTMMEMARLIAVILSIVLQTTVVAMDSSKRPGGNLRVSYNKKIVLMIGSFSLSSDFLVLLSFSGCSGSLPRPSDSHYRWRQCDDE
jgi:hypothetical protein